MQKPRLIRTQVLCGLLQPHVEKSHLDQRFALRLTLYAKAASDPHASTLWTTPAMRNLSIDDDNLDLGCSCSKKDIGSTHCHYLLLASISTIDLKKMYFSNGTAQTRRTRLLLLLCFSHVKAGGDADGLPCFKEHIFPNLRKQALRTKVSLLIQICGVYDGLEK